MSAGAASAGPMRRLGGPGMRERAGRAAFADERPRSGGAWP